MTRVKPVMAPHAGQSVNPALNSHKEVLRKVISEEEREIEENYKASFQRGKDEGVNALEKLIELRKQKKKTDVKEESEESEDSESDASDSEMQSEDDGEGNFNKPVDRLKKLTKNQRN